jgi:hypothetical protein
LSDLLLLKLLTHGLKTGEGIKAVFVVLVEWFKWYSACLARVRP